MASTQRRRHGLAQRTTGMLMPHVCAPWSVHAQRRRGSVQIIILVCHRFSSDQHMSLTTWSFLHVLVLGGGKGDLAGLLACRSVVANRKQRS